LCEDAPADGGGRGAEEKKASAVHQVRIVNV
jgi:hypothetical protein